MPPPDRSFRASTASPSRGSMQISAPASRQDLYRRRDGVRDHADFRRMGLPVQGIRQFDEVLRRQLHQFRIAAVAGAPDIAAEILAQGFAVDPAPFAVAAGEVEIGGDGIADGDVGHAGADGLDHAGDFMADDARIVDLGTPGLHMLDRQPGAAGDHPCHGLAGAGRRIGHGFERKRAGSVEDKGFHQL